MPRRIIFFAFLFILAFSNITAQATHKWAVQLAPNLDPNAVAAQHGFINHGQIGSLTGYYLFETMDAARAASLRSAPGILYFEQQTPLKRELRGIEDTITDPRFRKQWHLHNRGQFQGKAGEDANILPAWNAGFTGNGVVVASVDDGVWMSQPDLVGNLRPDLSYDYGDNDTDASPVIDNVSYNSHGTSVAGVMAADNDGARCGVGAAFDADLAALKIYGLEGNTDAVEAGGLSHQDQAIHIYNNSWGPFDNGYALEGPGTLAALALENGVTNGRGGLGSIYVWAAGNGRFNNDNVNADGYANSIYTIAVAASTNTGVYADYSEPGAPVLVNAPSSGGTHGIETTSGLQTGCDKGFTGTSAAAPLAAGVIALMLDANPNLTWRDVQHVLVNSADVNDPSHVDWVQNGAGYSVNHNYGFGRVNAGAAVALAQTWTTVEPMITYESPVQTINQPLPASGALTGSITVPNNIKIEHVAVVFNATHPTRGQIDVSLISPAGTESRLIYGRSRDAEPNYEDWTFTSVRHWDEESGGTWTLSVSDDQLDTLNGTFDSWQLIIYGTYNIGQPDSLTAIPGVDSVTLNWIDRADNETTYLVERSTDNLNWTPFTLPADSTTYLDTSVQDCMLYYYRVRATDGSNFSDGQSVEVVTEGCVDLLVNGSFEQYDATRRLPVGWTSANLKKDKVRCDLAVYEGLCAFEFRGSATEDARLNQTIKPAALENDRLYFEAATRGTSKIKIKVVQKLNNGMSVVSANYKIVGSENYTRLSGVFTVEPNMQSIKVKILHRSLVGRISLDGLRLRVLPD